MLSFPQIEQTANEFFKNFSGDRFEFSEAAEFLFEKFPAKDADEKEMTEKKLRNILDGSDDGFARTFYGDTFYILDRYLKGLVFRCKPRPFELEEGILVPGARFEPYHSPELFADDLELSSDCGKIQTKDYLASYEKVEDLYYLLGPGGTIDMFYAEKQDNTDAIMEAGGLKGSLRLSQTVFDFAQFYKEHNVRNGDILKFTLDSYMNGTIRVEHEPRPDAPTAKETQEWIRKFEKYLGKVCRDYKDSFDIPSQILYAYIYGEDEGNDLRKLRGPAIDTYHTLMQNVEFIREGVDWTLSSSDNDDDSEIFSMPDTAAEKEEKSPCSCGHDHKDHECTCGHDHKDHECTCGNGKCTCGHEHKEEVPEEITADQFTISAGSLESMDAICRELKADFRETEYRASVFDAMASGMDDFDEFQRVNGEFFELEFQDEAQKAVYLNFAEDIWEYVSDIYAHNIDAMKAPLRQRLLEINDHCADAQKEHETDKKTARKLGEIRQDIRTTLALLSTDAELEETAIEDLDLRIGDIEDSLDDYL